MYMRCCVRALFGVVCAFLTVLVLAIAHLVDQTDLRVGNNV